MGSDYYMGKKDFYDINRLDIKEKPQSKVPFEELDISQQYLFMHQYLGVESQEGADEALRDEQALEIVVEAYEALEALPNGSRKHQCASLTYQSRLDHRIEVMRRARDPFWMNKRR